MLSVLKTFIVRVPFLQLIPEDNLDLEGEGKAKASPELLPWNKIKADHKNIINLKSTFPM